MKVCTYFVLFRIFAYTNSSPLHKTKEGKDGVGLDLDGSLKLYVGKNAKNVSDKRTIRDNKISRRSFGSPGVETFTDFIQEVIKTLNTYDDNTYMDFITILDKEINKYHYKGYKYHELMTNDEFRNFIDKKFDSIIGKKVSLVKSNINEVAENIKHKRYDKNLKKLLNLINSMYNEDDRGKFKFFLTGLKEFDKVNPGKSKNELIKLIRQGLWSIIFHHYINLNDNKKKELQKEITVYLKRNTETPSPRFKTKVVHHKPAVIELNTNLLNPKNSTTKVFQPITLKNMDTEMTTVQITKKHKRRNNLRPNTNEESENEESENEESENEESENEETMRETSQEKSDSQTLILTFQSTMETSGETTGETSREITTEITTDTSSHEDTIENSFSERSQAHHRKVNAQHYDTLYIEDFYKTTKKPAVYKSEMDSRQEATSTEEIVDRLQATRPNTKGRQRHRTSSYSVKKKRIKSRNLRRSQHLSDIYENNLKHRDLRKSIAPPMPKDELSIEVFERERRKREKSLAESYSFVRNNSIQLGLKDYVKRRRNLAKEINELKKIYENIQRSKVNDTTSKEDDIKIIKDDFEIKDKNTQQKFEDAISEIAVRETQSNTHNARAQTETNEIHDEYSTDTVKNTNSFNKDIEDSNKETIETDDNNTLKKKKSKAEKINETTKPTNTEKTDTEYEYYTKPMTKKLYDLKSVKIPVYIELRATAKKKKDVTETTYRAKKKIDNEI